MTNQLHIHRQHIFQVYLGWFIAALLLVAGSDVIMRFIVFLIMKAYEFFVKSV